MFASDLVSQFGHPNGLLVLETKHAHTMAVLGSSFGNAPTSMHNRTTVYNLPVTKGESGVIVLRVYEHDSQTGRTVGNFNFFVGVEWPDYSDYPVADLKRQWVPKIPSRIGTVLENVLSVVVDGIVYTTGNAQSPQEVHVEDGNLICRFMNGNIDAEEFREEAGAPARELQLIQELRGKLETCHQNSQSLRDELRERENSVAWLEYRLAQWRHAAHQVHKAVSERWWWQRRSLLLNAVKAFEKLKLQESQEQDAADKHHDRLR